MTRKIHAFCIGAPKTGTVSVMEAFKAHYRSAHEPATAPIVGMQLARWRGMVDKASYLKFVAERDKFLNLEMESSNCVIYLIEGLVQLFPETRFILTVRDCFSWAESIMQAHLAMPNSYQSGPVGEFRHRRFQHGLPEHSAEEESLRAKGLFTVGGCFSYWAWHNQTALDLIPKERLLVVRTDKLTASLPEIAGFLGVGAETLTPSHSNVTKQRKDLLAGVSREFVKMKAREYCGPLMERFFPEIDLS